MSAPVEPSRFFWAKVMIVCVVGLPMLAALILGGWQAGWWFKQHNTNRQNHINRSSYGNQQTLRDEITKKLGTVTDLDSQIVSNPVNKTQLVAQRKAVANLVCQDAEQVTGDQLPFDQLQWVNQNCVMGSAK
jgi:hypothetical protein